MFVNTKQKNGSIDCNFHLSPDELKIISKLTGLLPGIVVDKLNNGEIVSTDNWDYKKVENLG